MTEYFSWIIVMTEYISIVIEVFFYDDDWVFQKYFSRVTDVFPFPTHSLSPDPLQQTVHSDGHPMDLWVHALLRPRQPCSRWVPFNDRVYSENHWVHQPASWMPHLLHLCLQGVHIGQGETICEGKKIFHSTKNCVNKTGIYVKRVIACFASCPSFGTLARHGNYIRKGDSSGQLAA